MGVYIKNMEMPTAPVLFCIHPDGKVFADLEGGWREYKAIPVPPHGKLGDLDKLADNMRSATAGMEHRAIIMHEIRRAPTVIEAEEGE